MPEKRKLFRWLIWVVVAAIMISLAILIWLFLRPKETYTSEPVTTSKVEVLTCISSDVEDAFFGVDYAVSNKHEIKATFGEEKLDSVSYNYYGLFESSDEAENADSSMHGKYNNYLGERNLSQQSLNPVFSVMNNDTKVSLYAKSNEINGMTATFFFIDSDEFQRLISRNVEEVKKMYESKGFTCQDIRKNDTI